MKIRGLKMTGILFLALMLLWVPFTQHAASAQERPEAGKGGAGAEAVPPAAGGPAGAGAAAGIRTLMFAAIVVGAVIALGIAASAASGSGEITTTAHH